MLIFKLHADAKKIPLTKRELNNAIKGANADMGLFWLGMIRPKHFTKAGAREYRYAPRQTYKPQKKGSKRDPFRASYTGRKLKEKGHTRPLVWSGESELRSRQGRVDATSKRMRVVMNVPALNFSPKGHRDLDMLAELTEVSDADFAKMLRVFQRSLDQRVARASRQRAAG